jgi:hypothetical protein
MIDADCGMGGIGHRELSYQTLWKWFRGQVRLSVLKPLMHSGDTGGCRHPPATGSATPGSNVGSSRGRCMPGEFFTSGLFRSLVSHGVSRYFENVASATRHRRGFCYAGTGVIHTSNITHMCLIAQPHGDRYSSKQPRSTSQTGSGAGRIARSKRRDRAVRPISTERCLINGLAVAEEADSNRWSSGLDRGRGRRGGAAHDRVPGCLRASRHQARTRRRRTGSTTCTGNSWLTAGAAAKRALLSQCGFSRSEVRGISSMTLTSGTPPRAPATTTRKWQGRRRRRRLALVRFTAMPVAISGSVASHRCSYRWLEANPRNCRLPQNCNRRTDGGENGAVAFA